MTAVRVRPPPDARPGYDEDSEAGSVMDPTPDHSRNAFRSNHNFGSAATAVGGGGTAQHEYEQAGTRATNTSAVSWAPVSEGHGGGVNDVGTITPRNGSGDDDEDPQRCCGRKCEQRCLACRTSFRRNFCFTFALVLTALNLLFFLCLSVLLVMVSVDILITLVVQVALPPTAGYAFGGAALITVVFPWIAVWVAVVADYSRWPAKYFLLHYHLRVALRVLDPLPILKDAVGGAGGVTGAGAGGRSTISGAGVISGIYSLHDLHEVPRDDEETEESITRSKVQVFIACVPMIIWLVALAIGVTVGRSHETGTVFFLTFGFALVLFVSSVEYDTAPTSASLAVAWFRWRPSESSSMRYILLNYRKFDLSFIGILSALLVSIVVFVKDRGAVRSRDVGFGLSIAILGPALIAIGALRYLGCLDGKFDERSGYHNSASAASSRQGSSANHHRAAAAGSSLSSTNSTAPGAPLLGVRHASTQRYGTGTADMGVPIRDSGTSVTAVKASVASSGPPVARRTIEEEVRAAQQAASELEERAKMQTDADAPARGCGCCFLSCCCSPQQKEQQQRLTWRCVKHFIKQHREFVLITCELVALFVAATALSAESIQDTWPVWLMVLTCAACSVGLWFMNVQSTVSREEEERGMNSPAVVKQQHNKLALKIAGMDEETQAVYAYRPPKHPPEAVYRIAYFVVGFVATLIVFVSFFDDKQDTVPICGACGNYTATAMPSSSSSTTMTTTAAPVPHANDSSTTVNPSITAAPTSTSTTIPPWRKRILQRQYPICDTRFPGDLSIVDIAAIAATSMMGHSSDDDPGDSSPQSTSSQRRKALETYFPNSFNVNTSAGFVNNTQQANFITDFEPGQRVVSGSFVTFDYLSFRMPNRRLTVIASRSAYTAFSALQDLYILSDAVSLEVAIMLVPLPFSDRLLSAMLRVVSLFKFGTQELPNRLMQMALDKYNANRDDDILLVGFSLGGFVSNIAAAKLDKDRISSVTIAPIGSGYQTKRFGFDVANGDRVCTSVVSEDDIEARFDMQMGLKSKIGGMSCNLKNSFCHDAQQMLNTLSDVCEDPLKRSCITREAWLSH